MTNKSIDKQLLERSNLGVLTLEQEYTIATIMALRKDERRKRKGENIAKGDFLNSGKLCITDTEDSDDIDDYERVVREKVIRNAQKYPHRPCSLSNEVVNHDISLPKSGGTSILPETMTLDDHLTSQVKEQNITNDNPNLSIEYDDADVMGKKKSHKKHKKHSSKKSHKHKKHENKSPVSTVDNRYNITVKTDSNSTFYNENNPNLIENVKTSSIKENLGEQLCKRALKTINNITNK